MLLSCFDFLMDQIQHVLYWSNSPKAWNILEIIQKAIDNIFVS